MKNTVILYMLLAVITVFMVISMWYLYNNRGGEKILELSFKSFLIPVAVAFGLMIWEFIKPVEQFKSSFVVGISGNPGVLNDLISGRDNPVTQLNTGVTDVLLFHARNFQKEQPPKLQLIETYLLHLLHQRYKNHWQIDFERSKPFFDGFSSSLGTKDRAERKVSSFTGDTLRCQFRDLHAAQKVISEIGFKGPAGSEFRINETSSNCTFTISDKYAQVQIKIDPLTSVKMPHVAGNTAALVRNKLNLKLNETREVDFHGFEIEISAQPSRLYKWNPKTIERLTWAREVSSYLEESIGWESILKRLESEKV